MRIIVIVFAIAIAMLVSSCQPQAADTPALPSPPPVTVVIPEVAKEADVNNAETDIGTSPAESGTVLPPETPDEQEIAPEVTPNEGSDNGQVTENVESASSSGDGPYTGTIAPQGTVAGPGEYTPNDLIQHGTADDCWLVVRGKVYDVTDFITEHPGGDAILEGCGKDATAIFESKHGQNAKDKLPDYYIGEFLDME